MSEPLDLLSLVRARIGVLARYKGGEYGIDMAYKLAQTITGTIRQTPRLKPGARPREGLLDLDLGCFKKLLLETMAPEERQRRGDRVCEREAYILQAIIGGIRRLYEEAGAGPMKKVIVVMHIPPPEGSPEAEAWDALEDPVDVITITNHADGKVSQASETMSRREYESRA